MANHGEGEVGRVDPVAGHSAIVSWGRTDLVRANEPIDELREEEEPGRRWSVVEADSEVANEDDGLSG